jgi:hypothetical protein
LQVGHFARPEPLQVEHVCERPLLIPESNLIVVPLPKHLVQRMVPAPLHQKHSYSVNTLFESQPIQAETTEPNSPKQARRVMMLNSERRKSVAQL